MLLLNSKDLVVCLLVSLLIIFTTSVSYAQNKSNIKYESYENSLYLFKLNYPPNLEISEGSNFVRFFSPEEQFTIRFEILPELISSLEHYTRYNIDLVRKAVANVNNTDFEPGSFKISGYDTINLGGIKSYMVNSTYKEDIPTTPTREDKRDFQDVEFISVRDFGKNSFDKDLKVGYVISYFDPDIRFSKNYPDIKKVVESFTFINNTSIEDFMSTQPAKIPVLE